MGVSTDAMLIYGIPLDEEPFEEFDEDDPEAKESGPSYMVFMGTKENGIGIKVHQSGECPMYFVCIDVETIIANRGHPRNLVEWLPNAEERTDWNQKLRAFVKKYDLPDSGPPGWYLASFWR